MKKKSKALIFIFLLIIVCAVFCVLWVRVVHVEPDSVGIKTSVGGVINDSSSYNNELVKGYVVYLTFLSSVTTYPTTTQMVKYNSFSINAKDGVAFEVSPVLSYQVNDKKADVLYSNYSSDLRQVNDGVLQNCIVNAYREAANGFAHDSLANNRQYFENAVNKILTANLDQMGLRFKAATSNLKLPQSLIDQIAERSKAVQNTLIAEEQKRQAEAEAELKIIEAEANNKVEVLKNAALTPLYIQKIFIEKWDGKLPVYGDTPKIYKQINE